MKTIQAYIIALLISLSCTTNSSKTDDSEKIDTTTKTQELTHSERENTNGFIDFANCFEPIKYPFVIGDSILWKSTIVEMRGLNRIDSDKVNKYLDFEFEKRDSIDFHELINFYEVGQISVDSNFIGLIYLKSYKSKYVDGGKRDIYKIVTFDSKGNLISQKNIAGFITDSSRRDDRSFLNSFSIDKDLNIHLMIMEQVADYDLDTLLIVLLNPLPSEWVEESRFEKGLDKVYLLALCFLSLTTKRPKRH